MTFAIMTCGQCDGVLRRYDLKELLSAADAYGWKPRGMHNHLCPECQEENRKEAEKCQAAIT